MHTFTLDITHIESSAWVHVHIYIGHHARPIEGVGTLDIVHIESRVMVHLRIYIVRLAQRIERVGVLNS